MMRMMIGVYALSFFCSSLSMQELTQAVSVCDLKTAKHYFSSHLVHQDAGLLFDAAKKSECPIEALRFLSKQYAKQAKMHGAETFALAINNQRGPGYHLETITCNELYKAHK